MNVTVTSSCDGEVADNFKLFQHAGPSNEIKFIALGLCLRYNFGIYEVVGLESDDISQF